MTEKQAQMLRYPFTAEEIEWRVVMTNKDKTSGQVAAFVDSRAIQKRLDTVIGRENWQNRFVTIAGRDNNSTAHICEISIYNAERGEWITKSDGAGCTDIEPIKGGLSNAYKRAASMWGIGRYLYELGNIWVALDSGKYIQKGEYPKLAKQYNAFVMRYLKDQKAPPAAPSQTNKPTAAPTAADKPADVKPAAGRFSAESQNDSQTIKILDTKVSRGATSAQTLVKLQMPDGQTVSGYIRGESSLKAGQAVRDLKIVRKNSPIVGDYNIIENYQLVA